MRNVPRSPLRSVVAAAAIALTAVTVALDATPAQAADAFKTEYDKGVASFAAGDYPAALAHFERAYATKPHPLCLFNMGQSHRKMDHFDEAIAAYDKFLATGPASDLRVETEGYLADLRRAKEARVASDEARRLFAAAEFAGAALRYERAYAIRAEPSLLYSSGLAHERAGNKAKAIEYYERFLRSDTDPRLRSEAETALRALRLEPDPAGKAGPSAGARFAPDARDAGAGESSDSASDALDPDGAGPPRRGARTVLWVGLGGGAVLVATGAVILAVVLGAARPGPSGLSGMGGAF